MLNLPKLIIDQQDPFAGCFYGVTTWAKAQILLIGVLLTPGRRRVSEALRVMGLSASPAFAQYHQVLNRAVWSPLALPIRWVLLRDPQGRYESIALLCTDPVVSPAAIPAWFVQGWQLEVTFEEARRHLGLETQRQWADQAIGRTTPLLLGLFSWITPGGRCALRGPAGTGTSPCRLVCKNPADFRRRPGAGAADPLDRLPDFPDIPTERRNGENLQALVRHAHFHPVLCRLTCKLELSSTLHMTIVRSRVSLREGY